MNIELLELIAELNMSNDKSRQALGAEIKRLTADLTHKRDILAIALENLCNIASANAGHVRWEDIQGVRKVLEENRKKE